MPERPLHVLAIIGSHRRASVTRTVVSQLADRLKSDGCTVDVLDLGMDPLPLYDPDTAYEAAGFKPLQRRVEAADAFLLGTPDYHGSISSTLKNFLDHFWHEFAGKLFASVVASHEKGLTVTDQIRTVARQCYAWTLPYGVSFVEGTDVEEGRIVSPDFQKRLDLMARDLRVYGTCLAAQRRADLAGKDVGFLAKHRK